MVLSSPKMLAKDANYIPIQQPPSASLIDNLALAAAITLAARSTTTVSITTAAAHGFKVGQLVSISISDATYAAIIGSYIITATGSSTTFTYTTSTSGTIASGLPTGTPTATAYNISPMPTATTELKFVFPAGAFALVVIPTAAVTDATYSYVTGGTVGGVSGGFTGGTFPLFSGTANVICGTEGDVVFVQRPTTTPIAFAFAVGK